MDAEQKIERRKQMEVRRGEIHWVEPVPGKGSEQRNNRPAVIVSNNQQNKTSSVIQVVYMTGKAKTNLPTHVTIESGPCEGSTVLCENVYSLSKERLQYPNSYMGRVSDDDMCAIDNALIVALGLDEYFEEKEEASEPDKTADNKDITEELKQAKMEAGFYKQQYEAIMDRIMTKAKI